MKAFRILALGALLVIAGAVAASAQAGGSQRGDAAGRRPDRLLNNLLLTDAQRAKVEGITRKYQPQMQAIYQSMNSGGDRGQVRQQVMALRSQMQPELRAVLTSDQQTIFDRNAAEQNARIEQMMKQQ